MSVPQSVAPVVLVVDDEAAIRNAVRDILELAAIDTIVAANGREAITLFVENHDRIGAILLDLRMPVLSGSETYREIRALDPAVRVILSSGYDDHVAALNTASDPAVSFLRKPYAMDALLARVQSALAV